MLAWMDAEALAATLATGEVHFHSRSRDRLWRKGETSGNVLRLVDLAIDCDGDALLVTVDPVGPTCHRGTRSCFDPDGAPAGRSTQGFAWLETLWATIAERAATGRPAPTPRRSSTAASTPPAARSPRRRPRSCMAAKDDAAAEATGSDRAATRAALAGETADLLYHTLVLLAERGLQPADVIEALRDRHRTRDAGSTSSSARRRPISRRRLPIRTSSHSPATGSGTNRRVGRPARR